MLRKPLIRRLYCRNMTLVKEIFPAATDSRFIRAVSIWIGYIRILFITLEINFSYLFPLTPAGYPCHRLFPHEPNSDSAARSQRVSEWASLPERRQRVREAHPGFNKCSCLTRRGLDELNSLRTIFCWRHEYLIWGVCRDYQRWTFMLDKAKVSTLPLVPLICYDSQDLDAARIVASFKSLLFEKMNKTDGL